MYVMLNNGILKKASDAQLKTDIASWQERLELAKEPVFISGLGTFHLDEYFKYIEKQEIIEDRETDVTNNEDGTYLVTTKAGYIFQVKLMPTKENPKDAEIEYIGKVGRLFPKINSIEVTEKNSNSIAVKVTVSRLNGGKLSYYYKKEEETEYHELEGKQDIEELTAEFTGLEQNKIYNIKVVAESKAGTDEAVINELTGELEVGVISQKGETAWSNGKASIELETTPPDLRIEYQVNGIEETWQPYNGPIESLNHKDTVYARITDGVNSGESVSVTIKDGIAPNNATITLGATTADTGANVTAKVTHNDMQSGAKIASCKWVYNTTSTAIGTNASSYTGGTFSSNGQTINLNASTPGTYYLHVLTVDNGENVKETISNAIIVKKPEPMVSDSTTSSHTAVKINYTWDQINKIAQAIANADSVSSSTTEVTAIIDGESYKIGVGDKATVQYSGTNVRVRILGFKYDDLVDTAAYGGNHTKASISFEFLDFMTGSNYKSMNSSSTNSGGWAATQMRKDLNGYTTNAATQSGPIGGLGVNLNNKAYIKQVSKKYIATYNSASSVKTCNDYLWLLAASEVVNNGYKGTGTYAYAITSEGSQYKYYKGVTEAYDDQSAGRKKGEKIWSWWLRSPYYDYSGRFCLVNSNGGTKYSTTATDTIGVAPGFCI